MGRTDTTRTDVRELKTTSVTDPAENAAVSTAILDRYSGVIITTTTTGNAQTLQTLTDTTKIKRFTVMNNDTSTNSITVNGTVLEAGKLIFFIQDGSAWLEDGAGGGGDIPVKATGEEIDTGTDDAKFVTPKALEDQTTFAKLVSPSFTTPALGTPSAGVLTNCTALPAAQVSAGTFAGALEAADHGTASTDQLVNVCYGTGAPPTASTTTEGALFIQYTA